MASASSSDDGVPASAGGFVDPLSGLAADEPSRELQQLPKGTRSYHEHDVRREVYVPVQRLHELPQWPNPAPEEGAAAAPQAVSYVHDFQHPQWRTGFEAGRAPNPRVHTRATAFAAPYLCTGCKQEKEACTCASCRVCLGSIGKGSRHHCRKCWNAVCGPCRKRQRHLNAMSWVKTQQLLCDTCAVPQGLAHLTEDPVFAGITLLKEAMDAPNQCVAPLKCGTYTYRRTCPSCSLPTVPTRPHVERLVRIEYCCSMGRKCHKCASAEQRMKAQERETEQLRYRRFDELTPDAVEAMWARTLHIPASGGLAGAFRWASDTKVRDLLLCLLSASACYEYAGFPHTALELSDVAAARQLLRLRECRQDFSVLEAPGNVAIVAFPGTHDIRTAITDVKFSRVTERTFGHVNNGLMRSGPSQPYRQMHGGVQQLWHYRMHEGFHEEERKLRMSLNTATLRNMIAEGKRIVFTGHSLGGALATLVTLRALEEDLALFQGKVSCITFGAPLVGNSALSTKVRRCGWTSCFTHVVAGSDVVPRLLTERDIHRHAVIALKAAVSSRVDAVRSLFGGSTPSKTEAAAAAAELELTMSSAQPSAPVLTDEDTVRVKGESDKDAVDPGFSASGVTSVLEKRAFDCFGEYHMLQRNVRYKATTNHLAAYNALRDGDGVRLDIGDHLLDSYNKAVALQIRSHVEGAEAGGTPAPK